MSRATIGIVRPQRAINVGCGRKGNSWSVGSAAFFTSVIAGNAEGAPASPVKTGMERNELVLAGVETCQLQRAFNRLGSTIPEERLRQPLGRYLADLLR